MQGMKRVLIFEDERSSQEIARRMLNRIGITEIAFAADGKTGLQVLGRMEPKPEVIICDILMPEKDGIEIINALVEGNFKGGLILFTGADAQYVKMAELIAIGRGLNFLGTLRKPMSEHDLANLLSPLDGV